MLKGPKNSTRARHVYQSEARHVRFWLPRDTWRAQEKRRVFVGRLSSRFRKWGKLIKSWCETGKWPASCTGPTLQHKYETGGNLLSIRRCSGPPNQCWLEDGPSTRKAWYFWWRSPDFGEATQINVHTQPTPLSSSILPVGKWQWPHSYVAGKWWNRWGY